LFRGFLSWRYMLRRRTNLIGIVGILVGVWALITILSIMSGFLELSRATLRGSLADLILRPYQGSLRSDERVPSDPAPLLAALREDPRIAAASAHLTWVGIVARKGEEGRLILSDSQHGKLAGVQLIGIDVAAEFESTELREALSREPLYGSLVADPDDPFAPPPTAPAGRPRPSVVLGEQLFAAHRLYRGAVVTLATVRPEAEELDVSSREFVVAGTFRSTDNEMDLDRIYLERDQLARFLAGVGVNDPLPDEAMLYNEVLIKLADYERDKQAVVAHLVGTPEQPGALVAAGLLHPHSQLRTWEEYRAHLLGAIRNERALMAIMLSLVLIVAGFTVFAILSMMVTEKRRDIGILTALGATPRGVMAVFLMIAFWDALIGCALGALGGIWSARNIDGIERWLSKSLGIEIFDRSVYVFDYIPSVVDPGAVAAIVLGAFACALLFAMIPAWKAARLDPLDALRYE
jgi:lipoprotein-releasing system permease protein